MRFREKVQEISDLNSDLYVIQECEDPDQVNYRDYNQFFNSHIWKGQNKNKGLGIFTTGKVSIATIDLDDTDLELFLPCSTNLGFNILAVWTKGKTASAPEYIGQFWAFYERHREVFKNDHWLILGDFNSNAIWDKRYKPGHSFVVDELHKDSYISAYHTIGGKNARHGNEKDATLYMYRKLERPYHVDYVFLKKSDRFDLQNLQIGSYGKWSDLSDHIPITVDFYSRES